VQFSTEERRRISGEICPSAANGDFGRFQELCGAFGFLGSLEVREIWGRMSKKRNLFGDPRMADRRTRKTAISGDFGRKTQWGK
jgi:hypothetical protein